MGRHDLLAHGCGVAEFCISSLSWARENASSEFSKIILHSAELFFLFETFCAVFCWLLVLEFLDLSPFRLASVILCYLTITTGSRDSRGLFGGSLQAGARGGKRLS